MSKQVTVVMSLTTALCLRLAAALMAAAAWLKMPGETAEEDNA